MHADTLRGLMGRIAARQRQLTALTAALHLIEALWCSCTPEQRRKAQAWTGFDTWIRQILAAVDWS